MKWLLAIPHYLAVGDLVRMTTAGWPGMPDGYGPRVAIDRRTRWCCASNRPSIHGRRSGRSTSNRTDRDAAGWSHGREVHRPGLAGFAARIAAELMDPITMVMTRKMLLGIRDRAKAAAESPAGV